MSLGLEDITKDPHLQNFIEAETQKQRYHQLVNALTDHCWDVCMGKPSNRLDGKTESCLVNCVERFIDASNFVINRLDNKTPELKPDTSIGGDSELLSG